MHLSLVKVATQSVSQSWGTARRDVLPRAGNMCAHLAALGKDAIGNSDV
jgi:hypothetical protein